jgi:hypothetical protein
MSNENSSDDNGKVTRTTIEVDEAVWRQLRSNAVADGKNISAKLEEVLIDYFDIETGNNE